MSGRPVREAAGTAQSPSAHTEDDLTDLTARNGLTRFIARLGLLLLASGDTVTSTADVLQRVSIAYGIKDNTVFTMPTGVFVTLREGGRTTVEMSASLPGLRLDQAAAVFELASKAEAAQVTAADGIRRLDDIEALRPRFGVLTTALGHVLATIGFALILQPTWSCMGIAAALGLVVGLLRHLALRLRTLQVVLPVVASFLCATVVFLLARWGVEIDPLRTLLPPLVMLLPGAVLTTATLEIADGQMISGSSRLVYATVQIVLLGFGIVMASALVHLSGGAVLADAPQNSMGLWAPWLGPLVFSLGLYYHLSAPRGSLPWFILVCYVAWIAQSIGGLTGNAYVAAFAGAAAMTPVAYWVGSRPSRPPVMVSFVPGFWILVPGALGLLAFAELAGKTYWSEGVGDFVNTVFVVVTIALGIMIGMRCSRWVERRLARRRPAERFG
jgi:uncharacterized membrane protein YjjP (DUF1212 family)